jgi:hypothetical protein
MAVSQLTVEYLLMARRVDALTRKLLGNNLETSTAADAAMTSRDEDSTKLAGSRWADCKTSVIHGAFSHLRTRRRCRSARALSHLPYLSHLVSGVPPRSICRSDFLEAEGRRSSRTTKTPKGPRRDNTTARDRDIPKKHQNAAGSQAKNTTMIQDGMPKSLVFSCLLVLVRTGPISLSLSRRSSKPTCPSRSTAAAVDPRAGGLGERVGRYVRSYLPNARKGERLGLGRA